MAKIIINTRNMTITDESGNLIPAYKIGWDDNYSTTLPDSTTSSDIYWLKLLEGLNTLKISGLCSIKVKCEFPRKVGNIS